MTLAVRRRFDLVTNCNFPVPATVWPVAVNVQTIK